MSLDVLPAGATKTLPLAQSGTVLWQADCRLPPDEARLNLLHDSERLRYHAIRHPHRQAQFLLGRLLLRHALSARHGRAPEHWRILNRPGLAPALLNPPLPSLDFSIAHCREQVLCLLVDNGPCGVDIEYTGKERDYAAIAAHNFGSDQAQALTKLHPTQQGLAFYRLWTEGEALYKARSGLSEGDEEPAWRREFIEHGDYLIAAVLAGG